MRCVGSLCLLLCGVLLPTVRTFSSSPVDSRRCAFLFLLWAMPLWGSGTSFLVHMEEGVFSGTDPGRRCWLVEPVIFNLTKYHRVPSRSVCTAHSPLPSQWRPEAPHPYLLQGVRGEVCVGAGDSLRLWLLLLLGPTCVALSFSLSFHWFLRILCIFWIIIHWLCML